MKVKEVRILISFICFFFTGINKGDKIYLWTLSRQICRLLAVQISEIANSFMALHALCEE